MPEVQEASTPLSPEESARLIEFARAFKARHTIDPNRPFYPWLYQILRRLCFNYTRDTRTRKNHIQANAQWLSERGALDADPAEKAEKAELKTRLTEAIEALPDRDREVLTLKEFEGMKYREIAELLEIPIGTVMSRLFAARAKLAEAMGAEGGVS